MHFVLILQFVALLTLANGTPIIAKKLLGKFLNQPFDGGIAFFDGRSMFGPSNELLVPGNKGSWPDPRDYPIRCGHDDLRAATRARLEDRTHRGGHGYGGRPPLQLLEAQIEISAKQPSDWTGPNS